MGILDLILVDLVVLELDTTLIDEVNCKHLKVVSMADPNGNGADDHVDTAIGVCKDVENYLVHDLDHH